MTASLGLRDVWAEKQSFFPTLKIKQWPQTKARDVGCVAETLSSILYQALSHCLSCLSNQQPIVFVRKDESVLNGLQTPLFPFED